MSTERDERWVYFALGILAVAYVLYKTAGSLRLPRISWGDAGKYFSYAFAPVFAVLSNIWRKKRAKVMRDESEKRMRMEGLLRETSGVKVRFSSGAKGSIQADVRLTRAALYLFDRNGRRDPMRFVLRRDAEGELGVSSVRFTAGSAEESVVYVEIAGPSTFRLEFRVPDAESWWIDLRRALGRSTTPDTSGTARSPMQERNDDAELHLPRV